MARGRTKLHSLFAYVVKVFEVRFQKHDDRYHNRASDYDRLRVFLCVEVQSELSSVIRAGAYPLWMSLPRRQQILCIRVPLHVAGLEDEMVLMLPQFESRW